MLKVLGITVEYHLEILRLYKTITTFVSAPRDEEKQESHGQAKLNLET